MTNLRLLLALSLVTVAACGDDGPGTGPITAADAEAGCRAGCENSEACDPDPDDVDGCTADCVGDVAGWVRADAFEAISDCVATQACTAGGEECLATCEPTSKHEEWETQCRLVFAECGTAEQVNQICETTPTGDDETGLLCMAAPAIIQEMIDCIPDGTACQAGATCISAVLETHGINN